MLASQNHVCAICKKSANTVINIDGQIIPLFYLDHDHKTGKFRGLLHNECNLILGWAQDKVANLIGAIEYLSRFEIVDFQNE